MCLILIRLCSFLLDINFFVIKNVIIVIIIFVIYEWNFIYVNVVVNDVNIVK